MGIFHSCRSTSSFSSPVATAKLILRDGELREFSQPVKVSQVLQNTDSSSFVCDSDDIDFGEFVSAVSEDEELQLGQLYFVLPSTCLNRPVQAEDMAALATKASAALRLIRSGAGGGGPAARCCGSKGVETLNFAIKKDVSTYRSMAAATVGGGHGNAMESVRERRGSGGGGITTRVGQRRFVTTLNVIVEELSD